MISNSKGLEFSASVFAINSRRSSFCEVISISTSVSPSLSADIPWGTPALPLRIILTFFPAASTEVTRSSCLPLRRILEVLSCSMKGGITMRILGGSGGFSVFFFSCPTALVLNSKPTKLTVRNSNRIKLNIQLSHGFTLIQNFNRSAIG